MKGVGLCFTCLFLVPLTVVHVDPRGVFFVTSHSIFFYHYNFLWPNDVTTLVLFKNTNVLGSQSKSANSPLHFQTCELFVHLIFANQPNWKSHTISIGGKGMQDIVISTWDWYMLWSCNTWKGKLMVTENFTCWCGCSRLGKKMNLKKVLEGRQEGNGSYLFLRYDASLSLAKHEGNCVL